MTSAPSREPIRRCALLAAAALLVTATGCGRISSHFSGHDTTRKGTLTVTPAAGPAGTAFTLQAGGLKAGEAMTFEIDPPKGRAFIGPPHTAGLDGAVSSTYTPQAGDVPGTYKIQATGDHGTRASATLVVSAAPPTTTTAPRRR